MAEGLPAADVVTLDRVICCYPDMPGLVGVSAAHARELWGAVLPRERLITRWVLAALNVLQRLRRSAFRVYLHSTDGVTRELGARGFRLRHHERTFLWQVMVWRRGEAG